MSQDGLYDWIADQDCGPQPDEQDETLAEMHVRIQREMQAAYVKKSNELTHILLANLRVKRDA